MKPRITSSRFFIALLMFFSSTLQAQQTETFTQQTDVDGFTVRHVVFNSTFLLPEVAKAYGIKRSKYESLLNVSLSPNGQSGGLPAAIEGTATNLMQQQKSLKFIEINEENTTYYLAPVRVGNEEFLRFQLSLTPFGRKVPLTVKFSQKVYADE
ncbi:MAG: hypothetical protein ACI9Y1_003491 [Lentisphaeria bacterium]|jgi:hypothetical protein